MGRGVRPAHRVPHRTSRLFELLVLLRRKRSLVRRHRRLLRSRRHRRLHRSLHRSLRIRLVLPVRPVAQESGLAAIVVVAVFAAVVVAVRRGRVGDLMAGERNLGTGRTIRSRVSDPTYDWRRDWRRENYPDPWRSTRSTTQKNGKPAGPVRKATTRPSRPASVRFGKYRPSVDNIGPVKERATRLGKVRQARTSAANLGRAANFTAPRGSRGGAKWHGK